MSIPAATLTTTNTATAPAVAGAVVVSLKVAGYVCCERRGSFSDCVGNGINSDVNGS